MRHSTSRIVRLAAVTMVTALVWGAGAAPAAAGCLRDFGRCGACARQAMREAVFDLDLRGAAEAYVDGVDCDIDLLHCLLYDSHHQYDCAA